MSEATDGLAQSRRDVRVKRIADASHLPELERAKAEHLVVRLLDVRRGRLQDIRAARPSASTFHSVNAFTIERDQQGRTPLSCCPPRRP